MCPGDRKIEINTNTDANMIAVTISYETNGQQIVTYEIVLRMGEDGKSVIEMKRRDVGLGGLMSH